MAPIRCRQRFSASITPGQNAWQRQLAQSGIPVRDPGQAGEGRREPALVGVEVPVGEVRDEQVGLGGGQDGGRVDQPVQVDPDINDPRENAERGERATAQPS